MPDRPILSKPIAGAQTVLVVDDVRIVRHVTYRVLSESGYRVFEAASAAEALEVLETARRIDLVIVDVVMPGVSGVSLVRRIQEKWPGMKVLFMSAYQAEVLVREGLERPNVIFLAKPFTRDELLGKVTAALRHETELDSVQPPARRPT
jgi:CheY-like chemotaxis protein